MIVPQIPSMSEHFDLVLFFIGFLGFIIAILFSAGLWTLKKFFDLTMTAVTDYIKSQTGINNQTIAKFENLTKEMINEKEKLENRLLEEREKLEEKFFTEFAKQAVELLDITKQMNLLQGAHDVNH